ncbi:MAG: flagellar biosynthesis protein FlhF, partial [Desulfobacca sp.]|nr:flagellar biosynthesis protein FlhF [Desulfobacca sp.]
FQASNFREALAQVKRELGDDAVILSSEEINGLRPKVEVVAAIDIDQGHRENPREVLMNKELTSESLAEFRSDKVSFSSNHSTSKSPSPPPYYEQVMQELGNLRASIEELKGKGYEFSLPEDKKKMYQYLRKRSIREDLALKLTEKATGLAEIADLIMNDIQTRWDWSDRKNIVLIGSTGVGKTTTAAKLCGQAIKHNKKVGFISLDTFRIGAIEQIRIYSKILGVPLVIASSPEEVQTGINKLNDRDMILIDTTGRNPKDSSYTDELKRVYEMGIPLETHLLISGSSSEQFMTDSFLNYQNLPINKVAFTKMDEAGGFGSIYNFSVQAQKPIAYVTTGQKVPNDIEFCNTMQLVDLILNRKCSDDLGETNQAE